MSSRSEAAAGHAAATPAAAAPAAVFPPATIVWPQFPITDQAVSPGVIQDFYLQCLDTNGNVYVANQLTFTIFLAGNIQPAGMGAVGGGQLVNNANVTTVSGLATIHNLGISAAGIYTLGAYVSTVGGGSYPAQNFALSPPLEIG